MQSESANVHVLPRLLNSIPSFCKRTDLSRSNVYLLMKAGRLRAVKVGGRTYIPEAEAQRFVAELTGSTDGQSRAA